MTEGIKVRAQPKQPSYLMESLEREGLWKAYQEETDECSKSVELVQADMEVREWYFIPQEAATRQVRLTSRWTLCDVLFS